MGQTALYISGIEGQEISGLSRVKESILKTLAYYDIFYYPLTAGEIVQYLDRMPTEDIFSEALRQLMVEKKIFFLLGFYSLQDNPLLSIRRKEGNKSAEKLLSKAQRIGRFLFKFPFTRAIGISGSLSKNFADEKADIDFFIITKANRLWIARTLMHLYKKLTFLTGRQHYHCMNYYIDETALLLPDQNIYSAIEIKTLVPVSGEKTMQAFFETNQWANDWLPACAFKTQLNKDRRSPWYKNFFEWMTGARFGNWLENYLFGLTCRRWKRKEHKGKRNIKGHVMKLITGKNFSRSNPGAFQEKVLELYDQKLAALKQVDEIRGNEAAVRGYSISSAE